MSPQFHLDQDVSGGIAQFLIAHYGDVECAKTATELGLHRAYDGHHLLTAAQAGRILVTRNRNDFITIHDAWMRWSAAWGTMARHGGILILPQGMLSLRSAQEIVAFVGIRPAPSNEIYAYDLATARWVQNPLPRLRRRAT